MADQDITQSEDITWGEQQSSGDSVATGSKVATETLKFFENQSVWIGVWQYKAPYSAIPLTPIYSSARNLSIQPEQDD